MTNQHNPLCYPENILDSIGDGVYVTDCNRNIVFWNQAAERITGWKKEDVLGKPCKEGILCHTDKENRLLCGKDACPLHRAIITGKGATAPLIMYAQSRTGEHIPLQVNVSPIYDANKKVVGGVEVFRDMSKTVGDLIKAKEIQKQSFKFNINDNSRLSCSVHNVPLDMVGGDYYAVEQIAPHQFAFLLADVMGHGTSAALHAMVLRSLWDECAGLLPDITEFINTFNHKLYRIMHGNLSFATTVCGVIDLDRREVSIVSGGSPSPFLFTSNGEVNLLKITGYALGMAKESNYQTQIFGFHPGDVLFLYTDGATEVFNHRGVMLTESGLLDTLLRNGYPDRSVSHQQIEEHLLQYSSSITLEDDVTFLEFRFEE